MAKKQEKVSAEQLRQLVLVLGSLSAAARKLGITRQAVADRLKKHDLLPDGIAVGKHYIGQQAKERGKVSVKPIAGGQVDNFAAKREKLKGKRFVFTSAQNNTRINKKFWASLQVFCKDKGAQLYVSRFTYNKSGFQNNQKNNDKLWYTHDIQAFILDNSVQVAEGLVFCGELDILPTAEDPLSGFDSYAGYNSAIIPHTKVAMKSLPRLKGEDPRFLYTTGTVTQRNYIQRKAGQKAEFHHVYGALYVEVDSKGNWFARQLIADNKGEFYDLITRYSDKGTTTEPIEAINYGDIHVEKADKQVGNASWLGSDSMLHILRPKYQFIHDLTDFSARNHHNINDPYFLADRLAKAEQIVEGDLKKSSDFLDTISEYGKVIVVESNHHEAFEKWLKQADGHRDPVNAEFWHEANARKFRAIRTIDKEFDIYEWALKRYNELSNVKFLKTDESFTICGVDAAKNAIECAIHGHLGVDGARGKSRGYRSIGRRVNVGHTHSAGIYDGVYCAGVSAKLDMGYNRGPSTWSHSHIITYPNGKRAIITIKNGKWHG